MKWLLIFLLLTSCTPQGGNVEFENTLLKHLPFTDQLSGLYPNVNKDQEIKSPPNTWIRILQARIYDELGTAKYHCLFYKIPGKEKGILRSVLSETECLENYQNGELVDWMGISDLKVWKPEFERKIFDKTLKTGRFYFTGRGPTGDFFVEVPLFNMEIKRELKRHSSALKPLMLKGAFVSKKRSPKAKVTKTELLGKFEDNYRDKSSVVCQEFSKDCKEVVSFKCDQCRFGWHSAIGISTCGGQLIRFCGVNKCGQRGMPACPRGYESAKRMNLDNVMLCYDGSPMGYCEAGLKTVCDGKVLVCL
jgi:hypothetical protein